jgi:hypothetical protein
VASNDSLSDPPFLYEKTGEIYAKSEMKMILRFSGFFKKMNVFLPDFC